jgi:hypothetical protein
MASELLFINQANLRTERFHLGIFAGTTSATSFVHSKAEPIEMNAQERLCTRVFVCLAWAAG